MRATLKSTLLLLAAIPAGAAAQTFLPYGGAEGNAHFAIEPVAAGYAVVENAVLSHGSLPAMSTYTSGISQVLSDGPGIAAAISADGRSLAVSGVEGPCGYEVFAIDGRLLLSGRLTGGRIHLDALAGGRYLVRLSPAGAVPSVHNFIKRN